MISQHFFSGGTSASRRARNLCISFVNVEFDFVEIFVLITPLFFFSLQDHIQEVLDKWHQIDDEIWAKLIVMERNRRVAKAYARAIPIQINGSDDGFDGFRY